MKARHEFKTEMDYLNYLKAYFAGQALIGIVANYNTYDTKDFTNKTMALAQELTERFLQK